MEGFRLVAKIIHAINARGEFRNRISVRVAAVIVKVYRPAFKDAASHSIAR